MSNLLHSLFLSLLPLFFFTSMVAQPNDPRHPSCHISETKCANIPIRYPFWRFEGEATTQYCGYQGFGIDCSNRDGGREEVPVVNLGRERYYVDNISYETNTIVLVDYDVYLVADNGRCPRVRHGIDLATLPLNFRGQPVNISFHYNCTNMSRIPDFASEIPCLSTPTNKSCVHFVSSQPPNFSWIEYSCDENPVTTVLDVFHSQRAVAVSDYFRALGRGFELGWGRMEYCGKCEDSGGCCGYNKTSEDKEEFICFCSGNKTTKDVCEEGSGFNWKRKFVIALVSVVTGVLIMCLGIYIWRKRNNKKRYYGSSYMSRNISSYPSSMSDPEKNGTYHGVQIFKYRELEKATSYFDSRKELGDGGFGTVYHGKLKDGREVAVKRLYENNYKRVEQFMNEIGILAHLRHRNLVSLYGCTTHHSRELLLVYEYVPNGTVADHLHGEKSNPGSLPWATRINIAIETASALVYLHASEVVHRDVKTNNILLDNSFTVKVADFGLSRLFPTDVTHVSTAPQGTPGYVDPEYHECYQLTNKSDVYSFGVVLIELISSKPAVDITRHRHEINLSNMALTKIRNDALGELVDPSLGFETDYDIRKMITAVAELAFRCLQNERDCRPTMEEVLEGLNSIRNGREEMAKGKDYDVDDDGLSLKEFSQTMSPDSVAIAWSTSTMSTSGG